MFHPLYVDSPGLSENRIFKSVAATGIKELSKLYRRADVSRSDILNPRLVHLKIITQKG